jgi:hypothetical protein
MPSVRYYAYDAFGIFGTARRKRLSFAFQALQQWPRKLQAHRVVRAAGRAAGHTGAELATPAAVALLRPFLPLLRLRFGHLVAPEKEASNMLE